MDMPSAEPTRSFAAFAGSLVLHLLIGFAVVLYGRQVAESRAPPPPVDLWVGTTLEIADETLARARHGATAVDNDDTEESAVAAVEVGDVEDNAAATTESGAGEATPTMSRAAGPAAESEPEAVRRRAPAVGEDEYPPDEGMGIDDALPPGSNPKERPASPRSEPADDLARRILAYRPKVTSQPPRKAAEPPAAPSGPTGAEGIAGEPRDFGRAFTRAIPAANTADPAWDTLPLGEVGTLRFSVSVTQDGSIGEADLGKDPAPLFKRVVDRTLRALRGGRFALQDRTRGVQRLALTITISTHIRDEAPLALGFRSPRQGAPGKAYFELPTGRRVEMVVELLP